MRFFRAGILLLAGLVGLSGLASNVWGSYTPTQPVDLLSGAKAGAGGSTFYSKGKQVTLNGSGATQTILSYTSGSPGYVSFLWIAINGASMSSACNQGFLLTITTDGSTVYSDDESMFFGSGFWDQGGALYTPFMNNLVGSANGQVSFIPIPFSGSVTITLQNNNSNGVTIWYQSTYVVGPPNVWPGTRHLKTAVNCNSGGAALTQDQVATLVNITGSNSGRLLGVYMAMDGYTVTGGTKASFLEGAVSITTDGNLAYKTSGTEDYFGMTGYFGSETPPFGNGYVTLSVKDTGLPFYGAMRFHVDDPINFNNALEVQWAAGDSTSGASYTGTVYLFYIVWYYTN